MEKYYYHVQCMVFSVVCSFLNNFAKLVFSLVLYECKHMQTKSFVMDPKAITSRSSYIARSHDASEALSRRQQQQ